MQGGRSAHFHVPISYYDYIVVMIAPPPLSVWPWADRPGRVPGGCKGRRGGQTVGIRRPAAAAAAAAAVFLVFGRGASLVSARVRRPRDGCLFRAGAVRCALISLIFARRRGRRRRGARGPPAPAGSARCPAIPSAREIKSKMLC